MEVYNSRGKVTGALVFDPGMHTGQVVFDQGWWSRYTDGQSYNSLIWPWINPTNEVYYMVSVWSPNMAWNETVCNVRLSNGGAPEIVKNTGKSTLDGNVKDGSGIEYGKGA